MKAGGIFGIMKNLDTLIDRDCLTVNRKTIGQLIDEVTMIDDSIIRKRDSAFSNSGGILVLKGNLASYGAIIKINTSKRIELDSTIRRRAYVFNSQEELFDFITKSKNSIKSKKDSVIIIRYEGPKGGNAIPTASRVEIATKSPLTGLLAVSNGGGGLGHSLKLCGYDMIIISGSLDRWGFISIDNKSVEILDTSELRGKDTWKTCSILKEQCKKESSDDPDVMAIGIAGENMVRYAFVTINYYNSASRCGIGAVMGSKKLKAIVTNGSAGPNVFDPIKLAGKIKSLLTISKNNWKTADNQERKLRVLKFADRFADSDDLPGYYFQTGRMSNWKKRGTKNAKQYLRDFGSACITCPEDCGVADVKHKNDNFVLKDIHNSIVLAWGGICGIENIEDIWKLQLQCEKLGLDCIEAAGVIGLFLKLKQESLIPEKYANQFELEWGDFKKISELLDLISKRLEFGNFFADGVKSLATAFSIGTRYDVAINNMTMYPIDPRSKHGKAWMLGHLKSVRGGDNVRSTHMNFVSVPANLKNKISYRDYVKKSGLNPK